MGVDLSGAGGYFRWSNAGWADALELGEAFGWTPMGTGPPRGTLKADWQHGSYAGNDGQRFYARDAKALADALERAGDAIAEGKPQPRSRAARPTDRVEAKLTGRNAPKRGRVPVQAFGPDDLDMLDEFIKFCRAGSFRIF